MDDAAKIDRVARAICQERCAFYGEPPCWRLGPEDWSMECEGDRYDVGCRSLATAAIAAMEARHG